MASSFKHNLNVLLVVSTDPAYLLGDALDIHLYSTNNKYNNNNNESSARPQPPTLSDPLTNLKLHILKVDPCTALLKFQNEATTKTQDAPYR